MVTYRTTTKDAGPAPAGRAGTPVRPDRQLDHQVSPPIPRPERNPRTPSTASASRTTTPRRSSRPTAARASSPGGEEHRDPGGQDRRPRRRSGRPRQVEPEYLRPNALINSEDTQVVELTRRAVGDATDPWEKASGSRSGSPQNLKDKNFKIAFAPASEVARNLTGDCTEHGVLTAAMCRAAGVPARVVVGLVYAETLGGFGFHLWNEVYVNRRWVAIDATFDQTEVDAVHIKLSDSSLDGVSPFEAFLPVVRVLGKMTIEPVEIR